MHPRSILALAAVPFVLILADALMSKKTGVFPNQIIGTLGGPVNVGSLTRVASRSCGQCHRNGFGNVTVNVTPVPRSLLVGQSTAITISSTSSTGTTVGGFSADVTKGTFIAGTNTKVNTSANAITHFGSTARAWSFNYKAPATGGLIELYTVALAGNGNSVNTGDSWSFHGSAPTNAVSTPVRLFANAATCVKPTGSSCSDGFGNFSVLGAPLSPTVGNSSFRLEGHGMPPSSPLLLMLSIGGNVPGFDMAPLGAAGCVLRTTLQIQAIVGTTSGSAARAEGKLILPFPIPNDNTLKGLTFAVQFGVIDSNSKRAFPMVVTNGLECTIH